LRASRETTLIVALMQKMKRQNHTTLVCVCSAHASSNGLISTRTRDANTLCETDGVAERADLVAVDASRSDERMMPWTRQWFGFFFPLGHVRDSIDQS
jgi:hypothetical protein